MKGKVIHNQRYNEGRVTAIKAGYAKKILSWHLMISHPRMKSL